MADSAFARSCQACWDPEGTAAIVRKKKAQRAAINNITDHLNKVEGALENNDQADAARKWQDYERYEDELKGKQDGQFWSGLQDHNDFREGTQLATKLEEVRNRMQKIG